MTRRWCGSSATSSSRSASTVPAASSSTSPPSTCSTPSGRARCAPSPRWRGCAAPRPSSSGSSRTSRSRWSPSEWAPARPTPRSTSRRAWPTSAECRACPRRTASNNVSAVNARERLDRNYRAAFLRYLPSRDEAALAAGYEIGRSAVSDGLTILDLVQVHHDVLRDVLRTSSPDELDDRDRHRCRLPGRGAGHLRDDPPGLLREAVTPRPRPDSRFASCRRRSAYSVRSGTA